MESKKTGSVVFRDLITYLTVGAFILSSRTFHLVK
jgi:hypothetical protein